MKKDFVSDSLRALLGRKLPAWALWLLGILSTLVFFAFARVARYASMDEFPDYKLGEIQKVTFIAVTALFAISAAVQLRVGRKQKLGTLLLLMAATGAVLLGKISLFDYQSDDYQIFLSGWVYSYTRLGIKEGLGAYIGSDYGPPYLYILQIISRFKDYPWQYLIKIVSMGFEILLGYAVMKLCSLKTKSVRTQLLMFHVASLLPTVVFNGAYWGQCDVIYTSFALMGLYMGMTRRSARSMIFFGLALAFKLQTVFILPVLLPLWLRKDIKLRHLVLIPAAYMAMMIPALWGGKSLHHVLTVYIQQAGNYNFMTMNSQSIYQFLNDWGVPAETLYTMFSGMALALGFAMLAFICAVICANREKLSDKVVLLATVLIAEGVPYFLPKMHERYTFAGGVLSLSLMAFDPKLATATLLFDFAAYICYTMGLPGDAIMAGRVAALFEMAALGIVGAALMRELAGGRNEIAEVKA